MPALCEANTTCLTPSSLSSSGTVSIQTSTLLLIGTAVEPPKPGLDARQRCNCPEVLIL